MVDRSSNGAENAAALSREAEIGVVAMGAGVVRLVLLGGLLALASCAQYTDRRGLEVTWAPADLSQFARGETTRSEVLAALGPPSQVISLDDETVLYYLFEKSRGEALILLVYNRFDVDTRYDRAVFFFDGDDRLTEFSTRLSVDQSDS